MPNAMAKNTLLKVGLFNAGSLNTNQDDFIVSMGRHSVDIMAINETWLRAGPGGEECAPVVPGYRLRHIPRPAAVRRGRGGGVGFYIKRGINARTHPHPSDQRYKTIEQMWITIRASGKKIAIGTAYRPPWLDVELFIDALSESINSVSYCDNIILLGDFNINMFNQCDSKTKSLQRLLDCLSLTQIVTLATHYTNASQTLIDVVCTDLPAKSVLVETLSASLCGHSLVFCEFKIKREKIDPRKITYRPLKDVCMESFNHYLNWIRWENINIYSDVNDMVNFLNINLLTLFDTFAPIKTVTLKDRHFPWITDNIKFMMRLRDEALEVYRNTKLQNKKDYYKQLKSLVLQSMYFEKVAYYKHNINNKLKNPKILWKNLKSTLLPSNKNSELPVHFNDADLINDHFLQVPGQPSVKMSQLTFYEFHRFDSKNNFNISCTTANNIYKIIKNLKTNAEGCDQITLNMLLMSLPQTLEALTAIVNASINTSTVPNLWKIAIVRPLPKITLPIEIKDLRPISILPCASKILEKVVCQQLTEFLEKADILPSLQSGFRKRRSTTTALLDVTDNILAAQDDGMCTLLVLLDFSRAFDAINTSLLLSKLSYYGFHPAAVKWFHSYLSDRYQYVELRQSSDKSIFSVQKELKRGVPQGSILGPILFILYCADIVQNIVKCRYHIYADDIQIYISFKPEELDNALKAINEDLGRIVEWSTSNCLVLNPDKTKFMLIGSRPQLVSLPSVINISIMGRTIERVYEARNLGLTVDAELRFENHITKSVQNCFFRLKTLYKLRPYICEELRIQLVEALVLSRLNYADIVFGPRLLVRTQRLIQRLQNACARFCFDIPARSHVTPFLNRHYILKMKSRRKYHLACLLFDVIKIRHPSYLHDKLTWFDENRQSSRRQVSMQLSVPRHRTAAFRGSFRYAATKCWNNLPPPIRQLKTLNTFRTALKKFLISSQRLHGNIDVDASFI